MRRGLARAQGLTLFALTCALVAPSTAAPPQQRAQPAEPAATDSDTKQQAYLSRLRLDEGWYARLETDRGTILIRLLPDQAPQSVAHFAALAEGRLPWLHPITGEIEAKPYYDGLQIHKVEYGERFEAGDPTATGRGAPPIYVPLEGLTPVDFSNPWRIGMAKSSLGKISGALFFVTAVGTPWLNGRHPCFGEVVGGQDVVREICGVSTLSSGMPRQPILLEHVEIYAVGSPPALPEPEAHRPPSPRLKPKESTYR